MIINNVKIVLADEIINGSVAIADGKISHISQTQSTDPSAYDGNGGYLVAGAVEVHTDNMDHHFSPRPRALWPAHSALNTHDAQIAAAGITTVFNAIAIGDYRDGGDRGENYGRMVDAINYFQENNLGRVDHRLHLRCELPHESTPRLFDEFMNNKYLGLVSLMDHTPGQRQFISVDEYKRYAISRGTPAEGMDEHIAEQTALCEKYSDTNRQYIAGICNDRGIPLASHDDATVAHVEESLSLNNKIAEFPTQMESAKASHEAGMFVTMGAPNVMRGGSHNGNVAAHALATAGWLDILSSDYVPTSLLESAFALAHDERNTMQLQDSMKLISKNPADALGLTDRGEIAVGKRADLVVCHEMDGFIFRERVITQGRVVI